ncbi:MAG TPA: hypothetical protein VJP86_06095 [Vicinamibacterales bacterium]|nr:hypothetical protein [Vicinamibacterales bacterium]
MAYALLLSLLIHVLLLRLTFDNQSWVRGFGFPWQLPTFGVAALRVLLVPPDTPVHTDVAEVAASRPQANVDQPVVIRSASTPSESRAPTPGTFAAGITSEAGGSVKSAEAETDAEPVAEVQPRATAAQPKTIAKPRTVPQPTTRPSKGKVVAGAATAKAQPRADRSGDAAIAPISPPDVIALERPDEPTWTIPPGIGQETADAVNARLEAERQETERQAAAQQEAERQDLARQATAEEEAQREEAARQEAARAETARLEAERQEAERQEAERQAAAQLEAQQQETARQAAAQQEAGRQEAARQEAAHQEAARAETARLEAERQEAERQAAAQQEAERQEAARQAAAQQEAERQEAARQAAAQQEAERQEAARQAAAQQEAQRLEAARQYEAKREERLRAIGRQLDEEAAQRQAASNAPRAVNNLPLSLSTARRIKLWGRYHVNLELVRYAEAWARRIQFNTPLETVREIAKLPHTAPMATVAIRSDGSVESVTIEVSSGVPHVDDALKRIVEDRRPYQPFQPELARDFDVIEIRRTWHFGTAVQLD